MIRLTPASVHRFVVAAVLIWTVACGLADAPKPANAQSLSLPDAETVVQDDFSGSGTTWEIVEGTWSRRTGADGESVFAQTATDQDFPVALLSGPVAGDLDARVRFRPLSGKVDASGGIVFRARNDRNYYLVRANALEGNFRLYRIADGKRHQIASTRIEAPALGAWHTLRVVAIGEQIQAYLDGELLIDHRDAAYASGRVGLWTKADAVTDFDDLTIRVPSANASLDAALAGGLEVTALHDPDGRHAEGRLPGLTEDLGAQVARAVMAEVAGLERDLTQLRGVAREIPLLVAAAVEVLEGEARDASPRPLAQVVHARMARS